DSDLAADTSRAFEFAFGNFSSAAACLVASRPVPPARRRRWNLRRARSARAFAQVAFAPAALVRADVVRPPAEDALALSGRPPASGFQSTTEPRSGIAT